MISVNYGLAIVANKPQFQVVNLHALNDLPADQPITVDVLKEHGRIKSLNKPVKILAQGEIERPLTVVVNACSKKAREKIEAAGGKVEVA